MVPSLPQESPTMAKLGAPLLSLGARGCVGIVNYSSHQGKSIAQVKPVPPPSNTPAQAAVRDSMVDSGAIWTSSGLTRADKLAWDTASRRPHALHQGISLLFTQYRATVKWKVPWFTIYNVIPLSIGPTVIQLRFQAPADMPAPNFEINQVKGPQAGIFVPVWLGATTWEVIATGLKPNTRYSYQFRRATIPTVTMSGLYYQKTTKA